MPSDLHAKQIELCYRRSGLGSPTPSTTQTSPTPHPISITTTAQYNQCNVVHCTHHQKRSSKLSNPALTQLVSHNLLRELPPLQTRSFTHDQQLSSSVPPPLLLALRINNILFYPILSFHNHSDSRPPHLEHLLQTPQNTQMVSTRLFNRHRCRRIRAQHPGTHAYGYGCYSQPASS